MLLEQIIVTLGLLGLTGGLSYDDIAKDECLKRAYRCEDHRVSVTSATGKYVTEPHKFRDICRRHKDFIACINDAEKFCSDESNITDFASMVLDNRISLKMFCKEPDWKKNYFTSVTCINAHNEANMEECRKEEDERVDVRPWWCLIPEPCEALERVFNCSVDKMRMKCGSIGAEVYRRMHLLKIEKLDVVCAFRRRNPTYCATKSPHYSGNRKQTGEPIKRSGPALPQISDVLESVFVDVSRAILDNLIYTVKEQDLFSKEKLKNLLSEISNAINEDSDHLNSAKENINSLSNKLDEDHLNSKEIALEQISDKIEQVKYSLQLLHNLLQEGKVEVIPINKYLIIHWNDINNLPLQSVDCKWHFDEFRCVVEHKSSFSGHKEEVNKNNYEEFSNTDGVLLEDYSSNYLSSKSDSDFVKNVAYIESPIESNQPSDSKILGTEQDMNDNLVLSDIHKKGYEVLEATDRLDGLESENVNPGEFENNEENKINYVLVNEPYIVDYSIYIPMKNKISSPKEAADVFTDKSPNVKPQFIHGQKLAHQVIDNPIESSEEDTQLIELENMINKRFEDIGIASSNQNYEDCYEKSSVTNNSDKNCPSKDSTEIREEYRATTPYEKLVHAEL